MADESGWSDPPPAKEASSASPYQTVKNVPARVLVVEDNATDALVIREVLKNCGRTLEIRLATDGAAALDSLDNFIPTLILLDLNLPKISGLELLAEIRRRESLADVPVVIVTSSKSARDIQAALELNATEYFCKPDSLAEFMDLAGIVASILACPPGQIA